MSGVLAHCPRRARKPRDRLRVQGAWQNGAATDGARFEIAARLPGRPRRLLWQRILRPVVAPDDRGPQRVRVRLPPGTAALELTIDPLETPGCDWTYWAQPRLEPAW